MPLIGAGASSLELLLSQLAGLVERLFFPGGVVVPVADVVTVALDRVVEGVAPADAALGVVAAMGVVTVHRPATTGAAARCAGTAHRSPRSGCHHPR